jgi:hypothetical protein
MRMLRIRYSINQLRIIASLPFFCRGTLERNCTQIIKSPIIFRRHLHVVLRSIDYLFIAPYTQPSYTSKYTISAHFRAIAGIYIQEHVKETTQSSIYSSYMYIFCHVIMHIGLMMAYK